MSTVTEIENAIERLSPAERVKLAKWWQERFDPDEGLEVRDDIVAEMDAARQQIASGQVADWEHIKRPGTVAPR
jgi:hypothetical protein